jgi:hypothetical protein
MSGPQVVYASETLLQSKVDKSQSYAKDVIFVLNEQKITDEKSSIFLLPQLKGITSIHYFWANTVLKA